MQQALKKSIPIMRELKNCVYILVPDLVLRSDDEVLFIMKKAGISVSYTHLTLPTICSV